MSEARVATHGMILLAMAIGVGCSAEPVTPPDPDPVPASVSVTPGNVTMVVGGVEQFTVSVLDASGQPLAGTSVTWSSSDQQIVSITNSGVATAAAVGTAMITVMAGTLSDQATVVVSPIPVASVVVSPTAPQITIGGSAQLSADPQDANGNSLPGRVVTWMSGDVAIATVDGNGNVTGVAGGSATITATSEGVPGTANVTVGSAPTNTLTDECATPDAAWIWCDDFDQDRLAS